MARRKNASFTGTPLSGDGYGHRPAVEFFYEIINKLIPDNTPVPIPPLESVRPKHDEHSQLKVFQNYTVRVIVPIALDAAGLRTKAAKLRKLPEITHRTQLDAIADTEAFMMSARKRCAEGTDFATRCALWSAYNALRYVLQTARLDYMSAGKAAVAVFEAAKLNPDATWEAVNEMLRAL
jgi:hypothetical protein